MNNISTAFVFIAFLCCCSYGVQGREKVYQHLHTDFINSETNNRKPTPQPALPNQPPGPNKPFGITTDPNAKPTLQVPIPNQPAGPNKPVGITTDPNAKPTPQVPIPNQPAVPNKPTVTTGPIVRPAQQPGLPNQPVEPNKPVGITTGPAVRPTSPSNVRDLVNKFNEQGGNSRVQNPTPTPKNVPQPNVPAYRPKENFPGLPLSVPTPKPATTNQFSYSSIVSGKKQLIPVPDNRPNPQTPTNNPSTGFPFAPKQSIPTPVDTKATTAPELISDAELKELSEALYRKDNSPLKHVTINYQGTTTSQSPNDAAPQPLITVTPSLWDVPTIAAMKALLDNYEQDSLVNEYVTPQEKNEENAFLDLIMATPVMRHLMTTLKDKGLVSPDPKLQRDIIKQIWFNLYSRGQGKIGSSGFEHIFLSEIKNKEISGLHNWLYFYLEEEARRANYLGYMKKITFGNKGGIVKFHFNLKGIDKPVDSMFVGTSPELEMALYSLCFITRADKHCPLWLDGQKFGIRTYTYRYRSKNMIGSAFPEI